MSVTAEWLRAWAEVLCGDAGDTAAVLDALGLAGATVQGGSFNAAVDPPGMRHVRGSVFAGTVESVRFDLTERSSTLYDGLHTLFAHHYDPRYVSDLPQEWSGYKLEVPDAPYWCSVAVKFDANPIFGGGVATTVVLERHRVHHPGEPRPGMAGMADQLRRWSEVLCADPAALMAALRVDGTLTGAQQLTVEPPPPGIRRLDLSYHNGELSSVEVTLLDSTLTQADLESRFGEGMQVPTLHVFHVYRLSYQPVRVSGATHDCTVFADLERDQSPSAVATSVLLRRDRIS